MSDDDLVERKVLEIPMLPVEQFETAVKQLAAEGWSLEQMPMATYHLVRRKHASAGDVKVSMGIDDARIGIIRPDGNIHYADGRVEKAV